ncbi:MAG: virulence factor TspB C-terminal domain-related protein [Rhodocyclaceae bacterium]
MDHLALVELRRLLLFIAGFAVGGVLVVDSAHAQALPIDWVTQTASKAVVSNGSSAVMNVARVGSQTVQAAANGGAMLRAVQPFTIANAAGEFALTRAVPKAAIARAGAALLRGAGPVGLVLAGLAIADAVYNVAKSRWEVPSTKPEDAFFWYHTYGGYPCTAAARCSVAEVGNDFLRMTQASAGAWSCADGGIQYGGGSAAIYRIVCSYPGRSDSETKYTVYRGQPAEVPKVEATDADLQGQVAKALDSGELPAAPAVKQILSTNTPLDVEPLQVTGPASLPGPVRTTTATGPAGQTVTQTQTDYKLGYAGNQVSVGATTRTTVTQPDGAIQTGTVTEEGTAGDVQTEPEPEREPDDTSMCEENPDALACQELGDPEDVDLPEQESSVLWQQEGTAAGGCPSPVTISYFGQTATLSFDMMCDYAKIIRPMVIGLAWLSAGIFLFMIARGTR